LPSRRRKAETPGPFPGLCLPIAGQLLKPELFTRSPRENAHAAPEGGKRAAAPQPRLLINHQKSLPWFLAFDPGSSFAFFCEGRERAKAGEGGEG